MKLRHRWILKIRPAFIGSFIKKLLRIKRFLIKTNNGIFFIDPLSNLGYQILSNDAYDVQLVHALKDILIEGDTFLDIGANEGYFSIIASKLVGKSGIILSIEPQTRLQSIIFRNIHENYAYNINVFQKAISDRIGTAEIYLSPDMNTGSSGIFKITKYKVPTEIVPQTTLSEFLKLLNIDKVKLLKMDIEGFEYEAILGSRDIFENNIVENIALELHTNALTQRNKSESDILNFLTMNGYKQNNKFTTFILSKNCK